MRRFVVSPPYLVGHVRWDERSDRSSFARQSIQQLSGRRYRRTADKTVGTIDQAILPENLARKLFDAFIQDQITLESDRLALYLGSKFANDYFRGFDLEPSARLAWTPSNRRTFWAAISRANRTPARRDVGLDAALAALPGPAEVAVLGNPNMKSEHVIAYEVGYRAQPIDRVLLTSRRFSIATTDWRA
ncbi:MAG: hypothetical protein DMG30_02640 [Acidobacteria bacterium]|nr:MAG: hypothetical protein DMG30_02640 [Acidobacteriota bacterium]